MKETFIKTLVLVVVSLAFFCSAGKRRNVLYLVAGKKGHYGDRLWR